MIRSGWKQLIRDLKQLDARLLVLDAARRFSAKTDEGPAKVRELTGVLRRIVNQAGVAIIIVHHDVKPPQQRPGAAPAQPAGVRGRLVRGVRRARSMPKRLSDAESLLFPQDYKFSADPSPIILDGRLIARLDGTTVSSENAETARRAGQGAHLAPERTARRRRPS
jgi:hypothetical protein